MIAALRLGLRLAGGTADQRRRSALVAAAAAVGTLTLLFTMGMVGTSQLSQWFGYSEMSGGYQSPEYVRFQAAVVFGVALPVLAMAGTVGRLSATMRDRRLGNLRLLGLTATQTRLVGAVESGVAALIGTTAGGALFAGLHRLPGSFGLGGISWRLTDLRPSATAYLLGLVAVPLAVTAISSLPQRLDTRRALERARRADARRPSWWRMLPFLVGLGLCVASWNANADFVLSTREIVMLFCGIGLTGVGLVLIVPVFVRLIADLMLRLSRGPAGLIAARRLQAQPAGVTRVISALMIGLFLVVGARGVVAAFESTLQYVLADEQVHGRQWVVVIPSAGSEDDDVALARSVPGVRDAVGLPWLGAQQGTRFRPGRGLRWEVTVGTCRDLSRLAPELRGCVDGEALWLDPFGQAPPGRVTIAPSSDDEGLRGRGATLTLRPGTRVARFSGTESQRDATLGPVPHGLWLPPDTPGLEPVLADAQANLFVIAGPGRWLVDRLDAAGFSVNSSPDFEEYDFVASLRAVVYSLAALILGLGLLTFAIAAIDRALGRRRELASLQIVGTPPGVLQRAQWLEAAAPIVAGTLLAIVSGAFAGMTYLRLDGDSMRALHLVLPSTLTTGVAALVLSLGIAGLTVLATRTPLTADVIRTE